MIRWARDDRTISNLVDRNIVWSFDADVPVFFVTSFAPPQDVTVMCHLDGVLAVGSGDDGKAAIGRGSLVLFHSSPSSLVIDLFWREILRHPHIHSNANKACPLSSQGSDRFCIWEYCLSHKLVPEARAVGLDQPSRRMWKMDRQNILARPGNLGKKLSPRPRGLRRIPVEDRRPIGLATFDARVA